MLRELILWCTQISQACLILTVLLWVWRYGVLAGPLKRLGPFIIINLLVQFYAAYLSRRGLPNLYVLHIYTLCELWAWSFFYSLLFKDQARLQRAIPWLVGGVSVLIVLNSLYLEPITGFNSNAKSLVQLLLIAAAVHYFFLIFGKIDLTQNHPRSLVFLNFAVLLYYSGSLFIFMSSKLLTINEVAILQQRVFWAVNGLVYVIFTLLLFYSVWKAAFLKTNS